MSAIDPEVVELNTLMFKHRLKIGEVLKRTGLRATVWSRWAAGAEPKAAQLRAVRQAVQECIAEKATA